MATLLEIAKYLGCEAVGDPDTIINKQVALTELPLSGGVAFSRFGPETPLEGFSAGVLFLDPKDEGEKLKEGLSGGALIFTKNPETDFFRMANRFLPTVKLREGISPQASVDPSVTIGEGVYVGPKAVVEDGALLGDRVQIYPGSFVGAEVTIGEGTIVHPNVTLYGGVSIGNNCIIHAGSVVGSDGFGFIPGQNIKKTQSGTVIIENDVEIGAGCCIDRGSFGATTLKIGTKLDNMVHIAHNVTIGEYNLLTAHVAVAGSSTLGAHCMMGGQSAVSDHVKVGDQTIIAGKSVVISDEPGGRTVWGMPAIPMGDYKRQMVARARLPKLLKDVRALQRKIENNDPPENNK